MGASCGTFPTRRLAAMTRSRENPFEVFEFGESDESVQIASKNYLRKFSDSAKKTKKIEKKKKMKKKTTKFWSTPSPLTKFKFLQFFSRGTRAEEKETCNELIDVDAEDGLDTRTPKKEISNEAIDLDAEVACDTSNLQKEFGEEAIDLDAEVTQGVEFAEEDHSDGLSDVDACGRVGMTPENCVAGHHACLDHLVSGSPIPGGNSFPSRSPDYQNVPTTISDDDDDDKVTEMNSTTYVSSTGQNEVMLRGLPEQGFGGQNHKIYGERDAVSISQRDVELLEPERFINDNIIDFYINYLKNKIEPDKRQRFHFFNCFFFRKLADLDKKPFSACEGREAFERVRTWTKKVNLFEKDYIFIPVNFKFHWSLIVVCHPGEVVNLEDEEVESSPKVPCILHMNSIKGSHRGLKNLIQSYLSELWKEKHGVTAEDVPSKILRLRFIQLELPQQENWYDCGLFLLHYVELFLEEAPVNFSPFTKANNSNFLSKNWFPPAEASLKRDYIRALLYEVFENGSKEITPADCSNKCSSILSSPNKSEQDTEIEIIEMCNSTKRCHVSSPRSVKCTRESGLVFSGSFELEAIAESFSDGKYRHRTVACQLNTMPTMEELDEGDVFSGTSINENQNFSGLEEIEDSPPQEFGGLNHIEETEKPESPLTSSEEFAGCVAEDSEEVNDVQEIIISPYQAEMSLLRPKRRLMNSKH